MPALTRLKLALLDKHVSQEELARAIGAPVVSVNAWINRRLVPPPDRLAAMATAIGYEQDPAGLLEVVDASDLLAGR